MASSKSPLVIFPVVRVIGFDVGLMFSPQFVDSFVDVSGIVKS